MEGVGTNLVLGFKPNQRVRDFGENGKVEYVEKPTFENQLEADFQKVDFSQVVKECMEDGESWNSDEDEYGASDDGENDAEMEGDTQLQTHPIEKMRQRIMVSKYELDIAIDLLSQILKNPGNVSDPKLLDVKPVHVSERRLLEERFKNAQYSITTLEDALQHCSQRLQSTFERLQEQVTRDTTFYRNTAAEFLRKGFPLKAQAAGRRRQFIIDIGFHSRGTCLHRNLHVARLIRKPLSISSEDIPNVVLDVPTKVDGQYALEWKILIDGVVDSVSYSAFPSAEDKLGCARNSIFQVELYSWLEKEVTELLASDMSVLQGMERLELGLRHLVQHSSSIRMDNRSVTVPLPPSSKRHGSHILVITADAPLGTSSGSGACTVRLFAEAVYRNYVKHRSGNTAFKFYCGKSDSTTPLLVRPKTSVENGSDTYGAKSRFYVMPNIFAQVSTLFEKQRRVGDISCVLSDFEQVFSQGSAALSESKLPHAFSSFAKEYSLHLPLSVRSTDDVPQGLSKRFILQLWKVEFAGVSTPTQRRYVVLLRSGAMRYVVEPKVAGDSGLDLLVVDSASLRERLFQDALEFVMECVGGCFNREEAACCTWNLGDKALDGPLAKNYGLIVRPNMDFTGLKLEIKKVLSRPLNEAVAPTLQLASMSLAFAKDSEERGRVSLYALLCKLKSLANS